MLEEGGYLVYSTCALAPAENDGVVKKLLKKYKEAKTLDIDFSTLNNSLLEKFNLIPENTSYGYQILPDINEGAGPIYFSLIRKEF